jgi:hypothetical protein
LSGKESRKIRYAIQAGFAKTAPQVLSFGPAFFRHRLNKFAGSLYTPSAIISDEEELRRQLF